jgi:hypothetical protein
MNQLERNKWPKLCLHIAIEEVESALNLLIPIPNPITHNVALTLDEALRSMRDALAEMPEDGE